MKAMIFAAGFGSRLKPLTNSMPKALVEVNGRPMLEWLILRLIKFDILNIIINVHHFSEQVIDFLRSHNNFNINIEISFETKLLDTGGGLKKAEWFFEGEKDILIHNCDILSDIDLKDMYVQHIEKEAQATLCVGRRKTNRQLLFDKNQQLCGWQSLNEGKTLWVNGITEQAEALSFNGIHIISGKLLKKFKAESFYPIIPEYLRLAKDNRIYAYQASNYHWLDLGKAKNIENVSKKFSKKYFYDLTI